MKTWRVAARLLIAALLVLLALSGTLWLWSGAGTSLATTLEQVARFLPAGQTLEVKDVKGMLRGGGSIGWLRWQQGDLNVEAHHVNVAWTLRPLLDGELRLSHLRIQHLHINNRRASTAAAALTPPTDLRLPFRVDAPFSVDNMAWAASPAPLVSGLTGHYIFNGKEHVLDEGKARIASGTYQIRGRLQAQTPMALNVQVNGTVQTLLPSSQHRVTVQAHAELQGPLAGRDATLALQARLLPEHNTTPNSAIQARLTARLQPWQPQPVAHASAHWQALDLAALWPQAPQTQLHGDATVTPAGPAWRADIKLGNRHSGPWNQQRLPLDALNASIVFVDGQWTLESLHASGAGGRLKAQGQFTGTATTASRWQGQASVYGINPAAVDTRLTANTLDGQLSAQQTPSGMAFDARLQAARRKSPARATTAGTQDGLRLQTLQTSGLWRAPLLQLTTLTVQTDDAQLQGQLTFDTVSQATGGRLALRLPGATAQLHGQIAHTHGQGELSLRVTDAALSVRWLQRWPGAPAALARTSIQGGAEFTGRWQGGWQQQGRALQLQASVRAPRLDLRAAGQPVGQGWHLREWRADLSGSLPSMRLSVRGEAETGSRRFALQTQARGGQVAPDAWQVRLDTAQVTAQDNRHPGNWTLQLSEDLALDWRQSGLTQTLAVSGGSARLSGPVPGTASVSWQPARWSQHVTHGQARTQWQTQGRLQGLPLAWLDLLGQTQLANLGLRGDLLFGGLWDATGGETLHLRASLERSGGDLQLQTDDANTGPLRAGVRDARLLITAEGDRLTASLRWDSELAGLAQADLGTVLQRQAGAWTWPAHAALTGTLRARLPRISAWSLLAPPGWRLHGTLDANAALTGTRDAPRWHGTLQAQELTVRSVADGIDFSNGTLRASLDGQRLLIDEFTLQGDGGGRLSARGSVVWLPPTDPASSGLSRLRMELAAQAQALRVSARADQRLVVSGQLNARLDQAHLAIRGTLTADQALFTLPQDAAPQLGSDVVVRTPGVNPEPSAPTATSMRVTPELAINLDLGQNFQVRGRGLVTRLAGNLELRNLTGRTLEPRLSGELRTVRGTYKAYGQQLDIEKGVLRFAGPYDNPALDILAIRPNLQQRVGVQISGTALAPVVRLYAEPNLPEAEKLAWLLLGRPTASGGAESAVLQQAALTLLGGNGQSLPGSLAQALGLDELSVHGAANNADTTTGATVTLGKRVARDFYVAYERSLAGTLGTFYIFYDLSRSFTLRAQTGEQSAMDLIFTHRYD